jgi:hypothetical protein
MHISMRDARWLAVVAESPPLHCPCAFTSGEKQPMNLRYSDGLCTRFVQRFLTFRKNSL